MSNNTDALKGKPKILCVKRSTFNKVLGYGSWSIITIGIIVLLVSSGLENSSLHHIDAEGVLDGRTCYMNFFDSTEHCWSDRFVLYSGGVTGPSERFSFSIVCSIIDVFVIGSWIYVKQQRFKFGWCEKHV